MKDSVVVFTVILLMASPLRSDDGLRIRYEDHSSRMSLTVVQDIEVREGKPVTSRDFSFELDLAAEVAAEKVTVTINRARAKAIIQAHDMEERLGTRHLTGKSFSLRIGEEGRRLAAPDASEAPEILLGHAVDGGFSIAGLLADTLPELPEGAIAIDTTWKTERPVRTLEGWAWTTGRMTSRHRVTGIDHRGGHAIVSVATEAEASLGPVEGGRAYSGDMRRTLRWTFDATDGRLLSIVMEQESKGTSVLPQGELPIHQTTRVEMAPLT